MVQIQGIWGVGPGTGAGFPVRGYHLWYQMADLNRPYRWLSARASAYARPAVAAAPLIEDQRPHSLPVRTASFSTGLPFQLRPRDWRGSRRAPWRLDCRRLGASRHPAERQDRQAKALHPPERRSGVDGPGRGARAKRSHSQVRVFR
jgi:hypothetical protein